MLFPELLLRIKQLLHPYPYHMLLRELLHAARPPALQEMQQSSPKIKANQATCPNQ
jgi:hypothetical protein